MFDVEEFRKEVKSLLEGVEDLYHEYEILLLENEQLREKCRDKRRLYSS